MVRPSGHRRDDDLGPVTDRTSRVLGRIVTASSRGMRERNNTSDLPSTPSPFASGFHYNTGVPRSSTQPPPIVGGVPSDYSYSTHDYTATDYESRNKRPDRARDILMPTQRKKVKSGHVAGPIWRGQSDLGLRFTGRGINGQELFDVATDPRSRLSSSDRIASYIQYLLGSSLFTNKSGNIVPSKLWP
ncbi:hypothetical protein M9H77_31499 [Catharanthus roseus]|uniref:Uncharacterized protein n=1 Tax=Catharanthus roseus TaxID=4058 RepID=A0ACC0A098_CATRO|nr:hypothetical protein M9H77_31499 [Catharanthus roseus]